MSAGLPYLQKLRKSDLTELAETSNLQDFQGLKKGDLEVALDEHLCANQTTYATEESLADYYKRLGPRSPAKRLADMVKSDTEIAVKKARRKTQTAMDQAVPATSGTDGTLSSLVKTPGRELSRASTAFAQSVPLPPSPAVVTDAIDRQTRRFSASVSNMYAESGITEYSEHARDILSSPIAITTIALLVEGYSLHPMLLPYIHVFDLPAIFTDARTQVAVPNLFKLLEPAFWAPYTLWSLTSLVIPLTVAYFINFPLKAAPSSGARRAQALQQTPAMQFDTLVFNITKGLLAYFVYAEKFNMFGIYQKETIDLVEANIYRGYAGIITGAGIAGLISLYAAILKK